MKRFNNLPIPAIATTLASLTLGNVYGGLGYDWLRTLIMICGTIVLLAYLVKIIFFSKTCLGEYNQVIPSSLYATFPMCMMILGAFFFEKGLGFGKGLWWAGVERSDELAALAKRIRRGLADAGIPFDRKKFSAHITLIRGADVRPEDIPADDVARARGAGMTVERVALMRSDRGKRGMVYREVR